MVKKIKYIHFFKKNKKPNNFDFYIDEKDISIKKYKPYVSKNAKTKDKTKKATLICHTLPFLKHSSILDACKTKKTSVKKQQNKIGKIYLKSIKLIKIYSILISSKKSIPTIS